MKNPKSYSMSFTTGGLFLREAARAAELFKQFQDWKNVRAAILDENLLQLRTKSSGMRVSRELCDRLSHLGDEELEILRDGNTAERSAILWVAVCRQYRFVHEFASEVVRGKFLTYQRDLSHADFDACFNAKAAWHAELDDITKSTQAKLRQVLFRIMHEAGLLSSENVIQPMSLSSGVARAVFRKAAEDLSVFPLAEADLKELMK